MFFGTSIMGIPGTMVGIAVAISSLWDGVSDPLVGYLSIAKAENGVLKKVQAVSIASIKNKSQKNFPQISLTNRRECGILEKREKPNHTGPRALDATGVDHGSIEKKEGLLTVEIAAGEQERIAVQGVQHIAMLQADPKLLENQHDHTGPRALDATGVDHGSIEKKEGLYLRHGRRDLSWKPDSARREEIC